MTKLTFTFAAPGVADVPIEVRTGNMALVARTVASQPLELGPGTYFVTTRVPDGEERTERVVVTPEDRELEVTLSGPDPDAGGAAWDAALAKPSLLAKARAAFIASPIKSIHVLHGNLFAGTLVPEQILDDPQIPDSGEPFFEIEGKDVPQFGRVMTSSGADAVIALPAWGEAGCRLFVDVFSHPPIHISLQHPQANLLRRLHELGRSGDAESVSRSNNLTAERLLYQKRRDPIAAVVGAYALLRFNDIERLHDWTKKLYDVFAELPDAAVIRGEHLSRLGEHGQSLTALLDLPRRGLPLFAEGISLALDRLRLYSMYGSDMFSPPQIEAASLLAKQLQQIAASTDFTKSITTLAALNPEEPLSGSTPVAAGA